MFGLRSVPPGCKTRRKPLHRARARIRSDEVSVAGVFSDRLQLERQCREEEYPARSAATRLFQYFFRPSMAARLTQDSLRKSRHGALNPFR